MIRNPFRVLFTVLSMLPLQPTSLGAVELNAGGYGTAGLSCFSSRDADYVANLQPEGPGRSSGCDAGLDSVLGLQVDLLINEQIEVGAQATLNRNADRSFTPELNIGQLRWKPLEELTLRFGRNPNPSFLHSENRKVGYAMPWVRPPLEVYGLAPLFSGDGVDALYETRLGPWSAEWHAGIGTFRIPVPMNNSDDLFHVDSTQGFLNLSLHGSNSLLKAGYTHGHVSFEDDGMEPLFDALALYGGVEGRHLAKELAVDGSRFHLLTIGGRYEREDWLVMGEFGYRTVEGFVRDQYGAYITVGHQFGPWLPYFTLAKRWTDGPSTDERAGIMSPAVEALLASSRYDTQSLALGLSREIGEHAKLKFQADWIQPDRNSWGLYLNDGSGYDFDRPGSDWLFTVNVDFVF